MDRSTKQKINKETQTLNDTIDQLDLIHIYRTFDPKTIHFAFLSRAYGTLFKRQTNLCRLTVTKIIQTMFSDLNRIKLETKKPLVSRSLPNIRKSAYL